LQKNWRISGVFFQLLWYGLAYGCNSKNKGILFDIGDIIGYILQKDNNTPYFAALKNL